MNTWRFAFVTAIAILTLASMLLIWFHRIDKNYKPIEFAHFLTSHECDAIIQMAKDQGMEKSGLYEGVKDTFDDTVRKSEQTWLYKPIGEIADRIAKIVGLPVENQEAYQVVHYGKGGRYDPHYDACVRDCKRMNIGGPRIYTFLIYLNDDFEGGDTYFPNVDHTVVPEKGKAVLFRNVSDYGRILPESKHGGNPVLSGEKWIINKWIHTHKTT
jgi:prolyl 4-hydroxylase